MALIYCTYCGKRVSDKATTCPHCGASLEEEVRQDAQPRQNTQLRQSAQIQPSSQAPAPQPTPEPIYDEDNGSSAKWWALAVIVILIVAVGIGFVLNKRSHNDSEAGMALADTATVDTLVAEPVEEDTIVHITPEFIEAISRYDQVGMFNEGLAPVEINGNWGYINTKGEVVIPVNIKATFANAFYEGRALILDDDNDRFIDTEGKVVFKCSVHGFGNADLAYLVTSPRFHKGEVTINTGYSEEKSANIFAVYDRSGKVLSYKEEYTEEPAEGEYKLFYVENDGITHYGLKDKNGKIVIPARYHSINGYSDLTSAPNGVVLVTLQSDNPDDYYSSAHCAKYYYGYADLYGNDTFPDGLKERCDKAYKIAAKKEEESSLHGAWLLETSDGNSVTSQEQDREMEIMAQLKDLQSKGLALLDELSAMRRSGRMDPMRFMYIQQATIGYKEQQAQLAEELGDDNLARQYRQQKEQLRRSFQMMENGY